MYYVTAKRSLLNKVEKIFKEFGFPLIIDEGIIPNDNSTLFVCSGMQQIKDKFINPDNSKYGSLQSCVRTNDLELVGDGTHLTLFHMLGNFSFGRNDYEDSIEMWDFIVKDLKIPITHVTVHPSRDDHIRMWKKRKYEVKKDESCTWTDGNIGGFCSEMFVGDIEIGNLVNTMESSTDVGFGWERIVQIVEGKETIYQTSLFRQGINPILSDHCRTLEMFWKNKIEPGNKKRNYICRRLIRRVLKYLNDCKISFIFDKWIEQEKQLKDKAIKNGRRFWNRHKDKDEKFWWETFGVIPEEIPLISQ